MPRKGREPQQFLLLDSSRICPVCQKEFVTTDEWVYRCFSDTNKHQSVWFCSYGCKRKYEKGEVTLNGRGVRLSEKKRRIWKALDDGLSVKEICTLLNVTVGSVNYYKSKWIPKGDKADED